MTLQRTLDTMKSTIDNTDCIINGINFSLVFQKVKNTRYSHSIVAGGFEETSYVTREIPEISLIIRLDTFSNSS